MKVGYEESFCQRPPETTQEVRVHGGSPNRVTFDREMWLLSDSNCNASGGHFERHAEGHRETIGTVFWQRLDAAMKEKRYVVKLEQDEETGRWVGSWDKRGGGGVIAEGITIERVMVKFRRALAVFLEDRKAARCALLVPKLVGVPKPLVVKIQTAVSAKAEADERQHQASLAIRKAVAELQLQGFKPRDIGTLLGVSRQWAHKLLKAG